MWAYRLVRAVLSAAANIFFREIHLVGLENVPAEGPVVFAGNHPNSLIDPVLIVATSGRIVHFAAKDKLFAFPMSAVLSALGAVPIARKMDRKEGEAVDNSDAFAAMYAVLAEGRSVGIFPEGLSHNAAHLARLRSGAARIALDAAQRHPEIRVRIVPSGLTYVRRKNFRSRVLVQYGVPIEVDEHWLARWRADQREAGAALTEAIEAGIRALTVNTTDWDTLRILDGCRRLYQPPQIALADRVELSRRFCEVYETLRDQDDAKALVAQMEAYLARLDDVGLTDRDLVRGLHGSALSLRALNSFLRLFLWLPLAMPGAPLHAPLLFAVGWAGLHFAPRKDVIGTSRLVLGLAGVLLAYVVVPLLVGLFVGWGAALGLAALLPLSGYATLRVAERGLSLRRLARSARSSLSLGREFDQLVAERASLQQAVVDAVQRYKPEEMVALFPR